MEPLSPPILRIALNEYREFAALCGFLGRFAPAIGSLMIPGHLERLASLEDSLNCESIGVCAVDLPDDDRLAPEDDVFWGIAALCGLSRCLFVPSENHEGKAPFSVFRASLSAGKQLKDLGVHRRPEEHLRFHTDGLIVDGAISVPRLLVIYNAYIGYRTPGNFHWIPFSRWTDRAEHLDRVGLNVRYRFTLAPNYFPEKDGVLRSHRPRNAIAPIFSGPARNLATMFFNGEVVDRPDGAFDPSLISDMRASLERNPSRYSIPQRMRRAVFLNNTFGVHARDVLEDPVATSDITRLHIRLVDSVAVPIGGVVLPDLPEP